MVDDHEDGARCLELWLEGLGHEVRVAGNGPDALGIAAQFHPELIVMDIGLPGASGYDVARQIRQSPWAAGTTLIAVTGRSQEVDQVRALEAGFDRHFTKPLDLTVLAELLAVIE